jgi:hypothetical protein
MNKYIAVFKKNYTLKKIFLINLSYKYASSTNNYDNLTYSLPSEKSFSTIEIKIMIYLFK